MRTIKDLLLLVVLLPFLVIGFVIGIMAIGIRSGMHYADAFAAPRRPKDGA